MRLRWSWPASRVHWMIFFFVSFIFSPLAGCSCYVIFFINIGEGIIYRGLQGLLKQTICTFQWLVQLAISYPASQLASWRIKQFWFDSPPACWRSTSLVSTLWTSWAQTHTHQLLPVLLCANTQITSGQEAGMRLFFPPPQHSYMPLWPVLSAGPIGFSTQTLCSFDTLPHCPFHPVWPIITTTSERDTQPHSPLHATLWILAFRRCLPPWHLSSECISCLTFPLAEQENGNDARALIR